MPSGGSDGSAPPDGPRKQEMRLPVAGPWVTQAEIEYVTRAAAGAWYEGAGEYVDRFEAEFAQFCGRSHGLATPSCTSALHLALLALGVGPGDEVIVPDITWIASAAPVKYVGATPVFADVDPATWCLTRGSIEECLSPKTRAVIAVDLYGGMPAFDEISSLLDWHGVALIEDAAEAVGSVFDGRPAGGWGIVSTFSFHGSKTLTTGEGGMALTDDSDIYERMQRLRDHGRTPGDVSFRPEQIGHKYKMSELQAAFGLGQLERIEELIGRKRQIFGWYRDELGDSEFLQLNAEPQRTTNAYWMVTIVLDAALGVGKAELREHLLRRGCDSRPFFDPLSSIPALSGSPKAQAARERNKVSYELSPRGINLPSALRLTPEDVRRVSEAVLEIVHP